MFSVVIINDTDSLSDDGYNALLPLVSPDKQARVKRLRHGRDARNSLLADVLARMEICRVTGLGNERLEFSVNRHGKPYLPETAEDGPGIHFNISHAGHYVACVIDDGPVGIDIEVIDKAGVKTAERLKIAERFFSPGEKAYITENRQNYRFYEIWTKKESRIKWEGKGLSKDLRSFCVLSRDNKGSLRNDADKDGCPDNYVTPPDCHVYYHNVFYDGTAVCHVCSTRKDKPQVKTIGAAELLASISALMRD